MNPQLGFNYLGTIDEDELKTINLATEGTVTLVDAARVNL